MNCNFDEKTLLCPKCSKGHMLPIEDSFGQQATSGVKGYVCTNPECNNNFFWNRGILVSYETMHEKLKSL